MSGARQLRAVPAEGSRAPERELDGQEPAERDLVERARTDPSAFGELFDRHHDAIFHYVLHRTADVATAQDLTAETFLRALRHLDRFRWRRLPFSAWLYRIASNQCVDHQRRRRVRRALGLEQIDEPPAPVASAADHEVLEAERKLGEQHAFLELHRAIRQLKQRDQEVLVLRYFEDKPLAEIADITGRPVGTVKSLIHRAVARLRKRLGDRTFPADGRLEGS